MTEMPEPVPYWYSVSAFPLLGIVVADALDAASRNRRSRETVELCAAILLLVALSNLRLGIRVPLSGHAMVAAYVIARRLMVPAQRSVSRVAELLFAIAVFAAIAYVKLVWWGDPTTLLVGATLGIVMAVLGPQVVGRSARLTRPAPATTTARD
jgi:hypothetical protein